jgi:thioredoxin 1
MILPCTDAFVGRSPVLNIRLQQSRISPLFISKSSGARIMKTAEMYETTILQESASRPVLVFFSAPWCGPCRLTNPVIKDVKQQFSSEIDVVEVCTDDLAEIAEQAGVVSIPTIQFYYQGEKMDTIVGCVAKSVLSNAVSKVLEDVSQIKPPTS